MSVDIYPFAIRFADLWAMDHHQMVDEIYSPDIHMESMFKLGQPAIEGSAQLHALEDRLAAMIPDHRHELVRVIAEERHACLETTVVGPSTGEYAPACVWWWLGADDRVAREVGYFDWATRSTDSRRVHGTVPPFDPRPRGDRAWYRDLVMSIIAEWATDPAGVIKSRFAESPAIERVNLCRDEALEDIVLRGNIDVLEIAAAGGAVAVLFTCGVSGLISRGTAVLTLDTNDQIANMRLYWDESTAVSIDHAREGG